MILTKELQKKIEAEMKARSAVKGTVSAYCRAHNINHTWLSSKVFGDKNTGKKATARIELMVIKLGLGEV